MIKFSVIIIISIILNSVLELFFQKYSLGFDNFIVINSRVTYNVSIYRLLNDLLKEMYGEKLSDLIPTGTPFMKTIFGGKK